MPTAIWKCAILAWPEARRLPFQMKAPLRVSWPNVRYRDERAWWCRCRDQMVSSARGHAIVSDVYKGANRKSTSVLTSGHWCLEPRLYPCGDDLRKTPLPWKGLVCPSPELKLINSHNQLALILDVLGTPTMDEFYTITSRRSKEYIKSLPSAFLLLRDQSGWAETNQVPEEEILSIIVPTSQSGRDRFFQKNSDL